MRKTKINGQIIQEKRLGPSLYGKTMSNQNYTDEELVAKYKENRDHQYLTELFTRHSDVIYRNALRKMKNPADAEDIVQIAYIKMVTDLLNFKGTGSVIGWMLQVVIFTCYDRLRSEKSRQNRDKKIMSERTQMTTPKNYELTEMIETHLNKLPEIYKLPITLQIMDGLTIKEVSDALEIPEKTIRSQIARGLEKLKASLQNVGVTASVISLGDMLKEIQQPMVPEIYKSNQYFHSLYQAKSATSTKLALTASSKGIIYQSLVKIIAFATIAIGSIFAWRHFSNISEVAISNATRITQKWDFENTKDLASYQSIGILKGGVSIEEFRGINSSKALMVDGETIIEFDISKFKLPIRLSYYKDSFFSDLGLGQMLVKGRYKKEQELFHFCSLREKIPNPTTKEKLIANQGYMGNFILDAYYIDENSADFWIDGKRSSIIFGKSSDDKKLYLYIQGKAIIDDLVIESIDKSNLPNKSDCEKMITSISYQKGMKEYNLDKEKFGIAPNSNVGPNLKVYEPEELENRLGLNNETTFPKLSNLNKVEWARSRKIISQKWDFENNQNLSEYQGFGVASGAIYFAESRGVNDSSALMVDENTLIEIDISKYKLPLKVSYKRDVQINSKEDNFLQRMFRSDSVKGQKIYYLYWLNESLKISKPSHNKNSELGYTGEWFENVAYINENSFDFWVNGFRQYFLQGQSNDKNKIYIYIKGNSIIDDLKIESVDKKECPEIKLLENAIATLEYKKGIERYDIDKEKLGLDKNGNFQPKMEVRNAEEFEYNIGAKNEINYPFLNEKNKVVWVKDRQKLKTLWDFEDKKQFYEFKLIKGNLVQAGNVGVNGSMCMGVEADSLIEFDISKFKLPIKISYSYDNIVPKAGMTNSGIFLVKGNCQKDKNLFSFVKLSPAKLVDTQKMPNRNNNKQFGFFGEWFSAAIYVSEDSVDLWFNGNRTALLLAKSNDNKKLYFHVLDKSFIDNILIESVDQESIPDVSKFISFASTIPFVKGHKEYYKLEKEKELLGLDKNSTAELGICDSVTMEKSLGLLDNYKVTAFDIDTEEKKAESSKEFLAVPK